MNKIKNHPYLFSRIIILFLIGILFLFIKPHLVINFIYFVIGSLLIFNGLVKILLNSQIKNEIVFIEGVLNLFIGLFIILFNHFILTIILSILFLIFPLIRVFRSNDKKTALVKEIPSFIIALVIFVCGDLFMMLFVKALGVVFIAFSIYYLVLFIKKDEPKVYINNHDYIDANYEERDS